MPTDHKHYEHLAERAIDYAKAMVGAPYGHGWEVGSWPTLSPLYSHITRHDHAKWYKRHECICSGLINVVRFEIADLPSVGYGHDNFPGGTGAIGRHLAYEDGTHPYDHVKSTPRGWLIFAPYTGAELARQGHVAIALGNARMVEARVPHLTDDRIEETVSDQMVYYGGSPFRRVVPPWIWLRR